MLKSHIFNIFFRKTKIKWNFKEELVIWQRLVTLHLKRTKKHQNFIWNAGCFAAIQKIKLMFSSQAKNQTDVFPPGGKSNWCVRPRGQTSRFPWHQIEQNQGTEEMTLWKYNLEKDICKKLQNWIECCMGIDERKNSPQNIFADILRNSQSEYNLTREIICRVKISVTQNICLGRHILVQLSN